MADLTLDRALDALNMARSALNPERFKICLYGQPDGVDVKWDGGPVSAELDAFLQVTLVAAKVVTDRLGAPSMIGDYNELRTD